MSDDDLLDWLRLTRTPGLGPVGLRRLLQALGDPAAALRAPPRAWQPWTGPQAAAGHADRQGADEQARRAFEATLSWQTEDPARRAVLAWGDPAYPALLLQTADPPPLLWLTGDSDWLSRPSVAIVGSRSATPQGLDNARAFARALSQAGLTVVSGLASGIDGAAHEGALEGPASTVAVTGCGPDLVYPSRHRRLAARIAQAGALLTEHPPGTPPLAPHFPKRNRIIAGMALGTLVVEAAPQSGSLITARLALEADREVFAIPGSIHSPQARGCLQLIQQGAQLVTGVQDLLDALPRHALATTDPRPAPHAPPAAPEQDPLLRALGHDPISLDELADRCGWPADALQARLLDLELEGRVARLPGGQLQRLARA